VKDAFLEVVCQFDGCLEFGLQSVHPKECEALGRTNNMAKVQSVMERLNRSGIHYEVDLMYGLPGQTVDSFRQSIDFCQENNVPKIRTWPLMLLRGTRLDEKRSREDWAFKENDDPIPLVVSCKSFDERDWLKMREISEGLSRQCASEN